MAKEIDKEKMKEIERLGKIVEPYWDKKNRKVKDDAPEKVKEAYRKLFDLWDDITTTDAGYKLHYS